MPSRGLHELLLTEALNAQLKELDSSLTPETSDLRAAEAPDRIALHLGRVIGRVVSALDDKQRVEAGVALARRVVELLADSSNDGEFRATVQGERPVEAGEILRQIVAKLPDGRNETIAEPLIPLLDTTLLTNAPGEPRVGHQIQTEVASADRIDVVMAFVLLSGLRPLLEALRRHVASGRQLRILTTTFTGSTEAKALDALRDLGAEVRVSYDTSGTRLHAKAWLFHRGSGFSTAYVGSSNLSNAAQVTGLEWNVRVSGARNPDVIDKIGAVFESYWQSGDFRSYDPKEFQELSGPTNANGARLLLSPVELRPEPFQERLLEQLALARSQGHHSNLLVSATGTGKTVMAAVDYARLRQALPRARLLFVAHREEILEQSCATFAHALRDPSFGELWVAGKRPSTFEHVFASIQSLAASGLSHLDPTHFDVVIVDEFHHSAAASYQALLDHVQPRELLGLTATPERADGLSVLDWFGGRIAAELRLWDAIDQHRLVPFAYYGIYDDVDLRTIPWKRGRGYDVQGLTNLLTANDVWARFVVKELASHVNDVASVRALGFCVSVEHARFMARVFSEAGVPAAAVWGDTPEAERRAALANLRDKKVNVVFSVDLFNEGVDVPSVDTLLLLRPTDSSTLFMQQLGRGLRRSAGKSVCTVLDFVGQHNAEYRFDRRLGALLGLSRRALIEQATQDFPFLPAGCHLQLEGKAKEIVLANLKSVVPQGWSAKVREVQQLAQGGAAPSLASFLHETGIDLEDLYVGNKCWSDLLEDAGQPVARSGSDEEMLRRAVGRLLHADDEPRLSAYSEFLRSPEPPAVESLNSRERRTLRMLVASLVDKVIKMDTSLQDATNLLWQHPQVRAELVELFELLKVRTTHLPLHLATHPDAPLHVHARYTRIELLAALGVRGAAKVSNWVTGVRYEDDAQADVLAFTLDKTSGQFSPTTRYRDYAISPELIHWESQSVVRQDGDTGRRYQEHVARGSHVFLFARLNSTERAFTFLGPATYVRHEGELPMAITWRLMHPLPGDLFAAFAAAIA